uniref:Putative homing endonuclease n=2 Tax=viral metagenome TaxID=1070528 RepID=A0A6M3JDG9_9ZZZZ
MLRLEIIMTCKYKDMCWRYSYTLCLREKPYDTSKPPIRFDLIVWGYADAKMLQKHKSVYAATLPIKDKYESQCPILRGQKCDDCNEYKAQIAKDIRFEAAKERRKATPRHFQPQYRVQIPPEIRKKIAQKCRYKCYYCNRVLGSYQKGTRLKMHIDHIIPIARGGSAIDEANLTLCCSECNQKKGANIWQKGCMCVL